jgi:phosphoenolpyruvate carboxylase
VAATLEATLLQTTSRRPKTFFFMYRCPSVGHCSMAAYRALVYYETPGFTEYFSSPHRFAKSPSFNIVRLRANHRKKIEGPARHSCFFLAGASAA